MSKFNVVFAANISAYSDKVEIEAATLEEAIAKARELWKNNTPILKPAYDMPWDDQRIVYVSDENDTTVADGVDL